MKKLVLLIGTVPFIGLFACGDENGESPGITGAKTQESACVVVKEGCTPGYWKQEHHFDSWPAGVTPDVLVGDVFDVCSWPDQDWSCNDPTICEMTLLDVLKQGGGGLRAFGRHAVAAYLNALHEDFEYPMGGDAVKCWFLHGLDNRSMVEWKKDVFEGNNELGCPLD